MMIFVFFCIPLLLSGPTDSMIGFLVRCGGYFKDNQFVGPSICACCVSKSMKGIYNEMVEKLYGRIGVCRERFELKISSQISGISLPINADDEVNFILMHTKSEWPEIIVEVFEKSGAVHETPRMARNTTINLECTAPPFTSTSNLNSPVATPHYKSVSGSNHPHGSGPSLTTTSPRDNQGTPASTNKHVEVDDTDGSETSDTEDESRTDNDTSNDPNGGSELPQYGGQALTGEEEQGGGSRAPNSSAPSMISRWTIPGSELYSIQAIRSKDLFEDQDEQGPIYKGQIFKNKKALKGTLGMYAIGERFDYKVT